MKSLKELREWFLADPDRRATAFVIADDYLVRYDRDPERFRPIPKDDIFARPVVAAFADDSLAWAAWIRKLCREHLGRGDTAGSILLSVAVTAQSRGANRRKRLLVSEAIQQALRRGMINDTKLDRARYERRVTNWLSTERKLRLKAKPGKLTKADKDDIATEFWEEAMQRFSAGDIPEA